MRYLICFDDFFKCFCWIQNFRSFWNSMQWPLKPQVHMANYPTLVPHDATYPQPGSSWAFIEDLFSNAQRDWQVTYFWNTGKVHIFIIFEIPLHPLRSALNEPCFIMFLVQGSSDLLGCRYVPVHRKGTREATEAQPATRSAGKARGLQEVYLTLISTQ